MLKSDFFYFGTMSYLVLWVSRHKYNSDANLFFLKWNQYCPLSERQRFEGSFFFLVFKLAFVIICLKNRDTNRLVGNKVTHSYTNFWMGVHLYGGDGYWKKSLRVRWNRGGSGGHFVTILRGSASFCPANILCTKWENAFPKKHIINPYSAKMEVL